MRTTLREVWQIEYFSREAGQGVVRAADGRRLPFDASVALVDSFTVGEAVNIELAIGASDDRVCRVEPVHTTRASRQMTSEIRVTPTGFLALRPSDEELAILETAAWDRFQLTSVTTGPDHGSRYQFRFVFDHGPALRTLVEETLGRQVDDLVEVSAEYPFEWRGMGRLDPVLEPVFQKLPGYRRGSPSFFETASTTGNGDMVDHDRAPPYLECWVEPHGLVVAGVLGEGDWAAWRIAFERLTRGFALREL